MTHGRVATGPDDSPPRDITAVVGHHLTNRASSSRPEMSRNLAVRHDTAWRNRLNNLKDAFGEFGCGSHRGANKTSVVLEGESTDVLAVLGFADDDESNPEEKRFGAAFTRFPNDSELSEPAKPRFFCEREHCELADSGTLR